MATQISHFYVSDEVKAGQVGTLYLTFAHNSPVVGLESTDFRVLGVQLSNFHTTDNGVSWTGTLTPIEGFSGQASIGLVANAYRNALDNSRGSALAISFDIDPSIILPPKAPMIVFDTPDVSDTDILTATIQMPHAKEGDFLTVNGIVFAITDEMITQGLSLQVLPTTTLNATVTSNNLSSAVVTSTAFDDAVENVVSETVINDMAEVIEISHYSSNFDETPTEHNPTLENIHQQLSHPNFFVFGENSAIDVNYLFANVPSDSILLPNNTEMTIENSTNDIIGLEVIQQNSDNILGLSNLVQDNQKDTVMIADNTTSDIPINYDIYQHTNQNLLVQTDNTIL